MKPYYEHGGITMELFDSIMIKGANSGVEMLSFRYDFGIIGYPSNTSLDRSTLIGGEFLGCPQGDQYIRLLCLDPQEWAKGFNSFNSLAICGSPAVYRTPVRCGRAIALAQLDVSTKKLLKHIGNYRGELSQSARLAVGCRSSNGSTQHSEVPVGIHSASKVSQVNAHSATISHGIGEVHSEAVL